MTRLSPDCICGVPCGVVGPHYPSAAAMLVKAERRAAQKRRDQERALARARKLVAWRPSR